MVDLLGPGDAGAPRTVGSTDANIVAQLASPNAADTFFADCVASVPGTGTPINQKWTNRLLQQIRRAIRNAGVTQNNADDDMLWKAMQAAGAGNFLPIAGGTMTGPLKAPAGFSTYVQGFTSAGTLLQSQSGQFLELGGSTTYTVMLPTISDGTRARYTGIVTNTSSTGVTLSAPSGNVYVNGDILTSATLPQWSYFDIWYDGGNWIGFACGPSIYSKIITSIDGQYQIYHGTTSWTVPPGVYVLKKVRVWGAGGGGGGAYYSVSNAAGNGGGGGEYREHTNIAVTPGQVIACTVPAGGDGGNSGNGWAGVAGGATSFGSYVTANGGAGGAGGVNGYPGGSSAGGSGGSGGITFPGCYGNAAQVFGVVPGGGAGGGAVQGGTSTPAGAVNGTGSAGIFPGGGGEGTGSTTGGQSGGAGANGFIIMEI